MTDRQSINLRYLEKGSESALSYFMDLHLKPLTFFADGIVHSLEVAEEIVCDSFLKLWQSRKHFESPERLKAFLYITTKNACIDYRRAPANRLHYTEINDTTYHDDRNILSTIIHTEFIQLLYTELDKLPEQQALVFKLSYFEHLTTEEICERLNTSKNTVFSAKSKAVATIKERLKKHDLQLLVTLAFFLSLYSSSTY